MSNRRYVQTFHQDQQHVVLWEGWLEAGPDGLYQVPLDGVEDGRVWSCRWLDVDDSGIADSIARAKGEML